MERMPYTCPTGDGTPAWVAVTLTYDDGRDEAIGFSIAEIAAGRLTDWPPDATVSVGGSRS